MKDGEAQGQGQVLCHMYEEERGNLRDDASCEWNVAET